MANPTPAPELLYEERTAMATKAEHERRLKLARSVVRDARELLTSSSGVKLAFDHELLRLYAENRISHSPALLLLIAIVGFAATLWTGDYYALASVPLTMIIHSMNVSACRKFLKAPINPTELRRYRRLFTSFDFLFGISWVFNIYIFVDLKSQGAGDFSLFAMLMVIAVFSMLASSIPAAVYAATIPVASAVTLFYLLRGTPQDLVLAGLTVAAETYFIMVSKHLHDSALSTLEARAQFDSLIGEVEQSKAKSDETARHAEAANLAKSRFLAQMSHELRTPLNAILGFSEVMKNEILGPHSTPTYREYAGDIHGSGQHLLNLINEILDLSRIEAGRYELNDEAVNLVHMVEESRHLLKIRANNRDITVHELFEPDLPKLWADDRAVRQICLNLLSNAIKFTPQGGEVWLKVGWTVSGGQYLSVRDNGTGISEEEMPIALAPFGQGSNAIKSAEQGAGLGLPIVKGLIELHGGTFTMRSKLREGTEVIVTFPAERVMTALPPVQDEVPIQPSIGEGVPDITKEGWRRRVAPV